MTVLENWRMKGGPLAGLAGSVFAELKTNRRAALGLLAITLLAGIYGLMLAGSAVDAMRGSYVAARLHLARISQAGHAASWPARARASTALREALERRLWPADSGGVARADLQDWIARAAAKAGLHKVRVTLSIARPKGLPTNIREVSATISAAGSGIGTAAFRLLDLVESDPRLLVTDRLHVQEQPVPALDMTLVSYARIVAPKGKRGR